MTEKALGKIAEEAKTRWKVIDCTVIHRYGPLRPGDQIVMVAVASAHRGDAFEACEFMMDYLKTRAPFWKKEHRAGAESWVEAKSADDEAASRWRGNK
jgi:molybdopterin synthase catalytic subunit